MKLVLVIFCLFTLSQCSPKSDRNDSDSTNELILPPQDNAVENGENNNSKQKGQAEGEEETSIDYVGLIETANLVHSYMLDCEGKKRSFKLYSLVDSPNLEDPVLFIVSCSSEGVNSNKAFGAVDSIDLYIEEKLSTDCIKVISYYSSPVGYTEYYIFDLSSGVYCQTAQLDELEKLRLDKAIDLSKRKYFVNGDNEGRDFVIWENLW